ncbi:MAG: GAF domain-containing protein [Anaerolineales bacterium]|jgi:GAF domain-containing protein
MKVKLTALYELGCKLTLLREVREIAESVLEIAARVLDFQDSDFLLVDESHGELYAVAKRGQLQTPADLRLPLDGEEGITVAAARCGSPVYVPDVSQDSRYVYTGFSAASELAVPVQVEDRVLGVINVESALLDAFNQSDQELLTILANQAALAIENARLHAEGRRQLKEMAAINQLTRQINASLDLQETLDAIVAAAAELISSSLAEVSLWDEKTGMLTLKALRCEPDRAFPVGERYPPGEGYTGWVVSYREPLLVPNVEARDDIRPHILPREKPFKAYVGVPLLSGETLLGTLVLVADQPGAFDEQDLSLLQALGEQASIAIQNARGYQEITQRHRELAALYTIAEAANRSLDLEELLQQALERVIDVTHADGGGIRLIDPQANQVVLVAHQGLSETYVREARRFPLSEEIVGWVASTGQPTLSRDMWTDTRVSPRVRELLKDVRHRSLIQVPLRAQEEIVGTLGVTSEKSDFFNEDDLKLLNAIGQQVGMVITNAQMFEETQRKARNLAAINAVASVINQPLSLQEIMDRAIEKVIDVMETEAGGIRLLDQKTGELQIVSSRGLSPEHIQEVSCYRVGEGIVGDVAKSGKPQVVKNVGSDPRVVSQSTLEKEGFNTFAVVPLRVKDVVVGTLGVVTRQQRDFTSEDMELLVAIGDQIGVAIANAQMFEEIQRRARELETLNSIASIINQPLPFQEIMDQALSKIIEVMGSDAGGIRLYDQATGELVITSFQGLRPEDHQKIKRLSFGEEYAEKLALFREPLVLRDLDKFPQLSDISAFGFDTHVFIPVMVKGETIGVLGVITRQPREYTDEELNLLIAIGYQIGMALENNRLYIDLSRRARELEAVHAVAAAVNRPGGLDSILAEGLKQALVVTGFAMGAIAVKCHKCNKLVLKSHQDMPPSGVEWLKQHLERKSLATIPEKDTIDIEEIPPDFPDAPPWIKEEGIRLIADIPLFTEGDFEGILTVAARKVVPFSPEVQSLLEAIGHQLGTAVANAQLRQDALAAERLAAVGRVATSVAHDLRSPLGGILRSAEFLGRPELSPDTRQKLSQAVVSLSHRLINTSQEILDYTRGGKLPLKLAANPLPEFLSEVLTVMEVDFSDRGIEVVNDWKYQGSLVMDPDRMAQVVINIATNARDAMPKGGIFTITTQKSGDRIEIRFTDTGPGVPEELGDRIFEPFFTYGKREGAGLGLAIARRIVEEHAGTLNLESGQAKGATFIVSLPG